MTEQLRPCYRHRRRTLWMVGCPECREYHMAAAMARRDGEPADHQRNHTVAA